MAKPRASTLVLVGALILAVLAAVNFYLGKNSEQAKRIWAEDQIQKITAAKEVLQQDRDELSKAKEALETQLNDATTQAKAVADQLASEKRAREALTTELAKIQKESDETKGRLEAERKEKLGLTEDLAKAKQSYQSLSNELTTLRQAKEALEKRVKEMLSAQAAEAERIVVKPTATPAGTPIARPSTGSGRAGAEAKSLDGKVLVVNREFNFVVVNLGSKDGLKAGTSLSVLRNDKVIGKTQVERIYENMAAATVLVEEQKEKIREGDLVRVTP